MTLKKLIREGLNKLLIERKIRFYKNNRWFSSSDYSGIEDQIKRHKERFGDDVTFTIDGIPKTFNTYLDFKNWLNDPTPVIGSGYISKDEAEQARQRVMSKRSNDDEEYNYRVLNKRPDWMANLDEE